MTVGAPSVCISVTHSGIDTAQSALLTTLFLRSLLSYIPRNLYLPFVANQHEFSVDDEGRERHSGNWHSLRIVNLESGSEIQADNEKTIHFPAGTERGWICEIVAFGDPGLFVKAAISKHESIVEYFIAEIDATNALKPIATLPAVFM